MLKLYSASLRIGHTREFRRMHSFLEGVHLLNIHFATLLV